MRYLPHTKRDMITTKQSERDGAIVWPYLAKSTLAYCYTLISVIRRRTTVSYVCTETNMWICGIEDDREGHNQEGYYNLMNIIRKKGGVTVTHYLPRLRSHVRNVLYTYFCHTTHYIIIQFGYQLAYWITRMGCHH